MSRAAKKIVPNAEIFTVPASHYRQAMAAGRDAANRRMQKAGRTVWNAADFALAARVHDQVIVCSPLPKAKVEVAA